MGKRKTGTGLAVGKPGTGGTPTPARDLRSMAITLVAPEARTVSIVGDFNDWTIGRNVLELSDGENWHITLQLVPGRYQYKFVVDGDRWIADPQNQKDVVNQFGTTNSILEVV